MNGPNSYRLQFPSVGPATIRDLNLINIYSREQLIQCGAEKAMQRFVDAHGGRTKGMCSCQAYQFEGIIRNCKRYDIPQERKEALKIYCKSLRKPQYHQTLGSYLPLFKKVSDKIDFIMQQFPHTKKDIGYGYRRTFANGQWIDMIDYKQKNKNILRFGRGAQLVRRYPVLQGRFDEMGTVIGKIEVPSGQVLIDKHLIGVLELVAQLPSGLKVFDT